ncbi:MAG: hypothetical protein M0Z84_15440 [Gammaproteobacteria bacterium]|nr:hypothetical protein [Gammaproteobacteria bacterium]
MKRNVVWLSVFAIAMALLEAAVVIYLRRLYYPGDILKIFPPRILARLDLELELSREAATLVMLFGVAVLAERGFVRVFAAFVYSFGLWDIFYYVWLKAFIGWPVHWGGWDILFLIPWAWLGPWMAAALVAAMFVIWGSAVLTLRGSYRATYLNAALFTAGTVLVLVSFLQPAFSLLGRGERALANYRPGGFWWWAYGSGYILMAAALVRIFFDGRREA